jgi:hypothetical protein
LVEQQEFKDLILHLNPLTQTISKTTLVRDLQKEFNKGQEGLKAELKEHVNAGGRVSLTTDCWTSPNWKEFAAVTVHIIKKDSWEHKATILDIIELENPSYTGLYLAQELIKVTDAYDITKAVISVTRDNATTNDTLLSEYQEMVQLQYQQMGEEDQARFFLQFQREEGDIGCVSHIYNLGVMAG